MPATNDPPIPSGFTRPPTAAQTSVVLESDVQAPAAARQFLARHAAGLPASVLADAQLLISELTTNAIRQGEPSITLQVRADPPGVGVSVHDHGPPLPGTVPGVPAADQPSGRGLLIVAAIADDWGVQTSNPPPGKTVWFTLGTPAS